MKRFIQGEHRGQSTLYPESLDDYVSDTNSVRVVDVFVDELDLVKLGLMAPFQPNPADLHTPRHRSEDLYLRLPKSHPVELTSWA